MERIFLDYRHFKPMNRFNSTIHSTKLKTGTALCGILPSGLVAINQDECLSEWLATVQPQDLGWRQQSRSEVLWPMVFGRSGLEIMMLPQKAVNLHIVHYSMLWSVQEAEDFKLLVIYFQQQRSLWLPGVWYVFWRRQKERKSFHFEKHSALASSLSWQRSCVGVSSLKGNQIAHHRQLRWITLPVFAERLLTAPHPIPASCNTWCIGVYLVFTSYYCHSAKLILESKGFFVKRRLQLPEYESVLLILAAVMNNTLDKSLLWAEQGTRLAGVDLSSGTSLLADLRCVASFINFFFPFPVLVLFAHAVPSLKQSFFYIFLLYLRGESYFMSQM